MNEGQENIQANFPLSIFQFLIKLNPTRLKLRSNAVVTLHKYTVLAGQP